LTYYCMDCNNFRICS